VEADRRLARASDDRHRPELRTNASVTTAVRRRSRLERAVAPRTLRAAAPPVEVVEPVPVVAPRPRRGAVVLLTALFGWLTAPLFLHRNS
jgi:hypothetical protein